MIFSFHTGGGALPPPVSRPQFCIKGGYKMTDGISNAGWDRSRCLAAWLMTGLLAVLATWVAPGFVGAVKAADFPTRPIIIFVGFAPGGTTDIVARLLGQEISADLGQPVIIENRPGANGSVAISQVQQSEPDGHTLLAVPLSFVINPHIYDDVKYSPTKDLAAVSGLAWFPLYLVTNPSKPARLEDLIGQAKEQPGQFDYATSGAGSTTHIAAELFAHMAGLELSQIPYGGGSAAVTSVVSGETDLHFAASTALEFVKAGKLNLLAVTSAERLPSNPDIPTVAETLPGFEATAWNALFAPAGTPPEVVERINASVHKAFKQPAVLEALTKLDMQPLPGEPAAFAKWIADEELKWSKVIEERGITIQ